ncbi:MAG: redoxin, partial [Gemmataceae bacterium]|nr:redoxin [Gemmataceae bacterium]
MKLLAWPLLLAASTFAAERPDQVAWTFSVEPAAAAPGSRVVGRLTGKLSPGWHLYSFSTPAAMPATIRLPEGSPLQAFRVFQPKPVRAFDPNFNSDTETFEHEVVFYVEGTLRPDVAAGPSEIALNLKYQTCSDKLCVPGRATVTAAAIAIDPAAKAAPPAIPAGYSEPRPPDASAPAPAPSARQESWAGFLLVAFGFGLAAIFTPCVFPMIPITMSYFLNRPSGGRRESVVQAGIFCIGIVVAFSALGLALTAALGPFGVVQLASNPWVNG